MFRRPTSVQSKFEPYLGKMEYSLIPYDLAARGNLAFIEKYLTTYPHLINQPWNGISTPNLGNYNALDPSMIPLIEQRTHNGMFSGIGASLIIGASINFFVAPFFILACGYGSDVYRDNYIKHHKGWTLAEFAAETGEIETVRFLISMNPDILKNQRIFQIAANNKHYHLHTYLIAELKPKKEKKATKLFDKNKINDMHQLLEEGNPLLDETDIKLLINTYKTKDCEQLNTNLAAQLQVFINRVDLFSDAVKAEIEAEIAVPVCTYVNKYVETKKEFIQNLEQFSNELTQGAAKQLCDKTIAEQKEHIEAFIKANNLTSIPQPTPPNPAPRVSPSKRRFFPGSNAVRGQYKFGLIDRKVKFTIGDCFFDAVIASRPEKGWTMQALRNEIKTEMLKLNHEQLKVHTPTNENGKHYIENYEFLDASVISTQTVEFDSYEEYCEYLSKPTIYIDNTQINTFVNLYQVCCILIPKHGKFHSGHTIGVNYISDNNPPIFLGQENELGGGHYVALACPQGKTWKDVCKEAGVTLPCESEQSLGR